MKQLLILLSLFVFSINETAVIAQNIDLNGEWQFGVNREYSKIIEVPGITEDPSLINKEKIWYKRSVQLPNGKWKFATLKLKGARFVPEVYVNGIMVSKKNGGMAPTLHLLKHKEVKPEKIIDLEIALSPLTDVPRTDASFIPEADHWRSNVSSYLWDDVILKLHNELRIDRLIPFYDIELKNIKFKYGLYDVDMKSSNKSYTVILQISDMSGNLLIDERFDKSGLNGEVSINYGDKIKLWSPEIPNRYLLNFLIYDKKTLLDKEEKIIGIKKFEVINKQFYLNNRPCKVRAGSVGWHRSSRNIDNKDVIFDTAWYHKNIIKNLKERGANTLRFHLCNPPERMLDLCDKYGLLVQTEWLFFHGLPASGESLNEQWRNWLDYSLLHPSVALIHPYNETSTDQLKTAWIVLNELMLQYPKIVVEDRDVIHVHKYWWSLFENLGLYYDSFDEFPKAIMVDEFGGNYLDFEGNMGLYPTVKESYLRFLGRNHTKEMRFHHHAISHSQIAEYWRRMGAAGFGPFTILDSKEDGSHWFLDNIQEPVLKPVWNALIAAWSPISVSIELWDRNYSPGQEIKFPLYLFNDTEKDHILNVKIMLLDSNEKVIFSNMMSRSVTSFSRAIDTISLTIPKQEGRYVVKAELLNPDPSVKYPVVSKWEINSFILHVPDKLKNISIAIDPNELALLQFLKSNNIKSTSFDDKKANAVLLSSASWKKIAAKDMKFIMKIEKSINSGIPVLMLDAGDIYLGQGYMSAEKKMSYMQGVFRLDSSITNKYPFVNGIELSFEQIAEPESHIHPDKENNYLWKNIPYDHTWLWNGLRGGIINPATSMTITGLSQDAFLKNWQSRGADINKIKTENYYAYELQGYYRFSDLPKDEIVQNDLKKQVKFLVDDAPALASSINPNAPVRVNNLFEEYKVAINGQAKSLHPLVNSGKNLLQTPVVLVDFGDNKGKLIISQLITESRLNKENCSNDLYALKYDVVAAQFVLNMLNTLIEK